MKVVLSVSRRTPTILQDLSDASCIMNVKILFCK